MAAASVAVKNPASMPPNTSTTKNKGGSATINLMIPSFNPKVTPLP